MNMMVKELELYQMITENADDTAISNFFCEATVSGGASIARKAKETLNKIIKAFKEFISKIRAKFVSAKTRAKLKAAAAINGIKIRFKFRDKEVSSGIKKLRSELDKAIKEIDRIDKDLASHKLDQQEADQKMDKVAQNMDKVIINVTNSSATNSSQSPAVEVSSVARYGLKLDQIQESFIDEVEKKVKSKVQETEKEIEQLDAKADTVNPAEESGIKAESVIKTKKASFLSKYGKKIISTAVVLCGVAVAATACYKSQQRIRADFNNNNFIDYSDDDDY